jgi:hypothetical protein
MAFTQSIHPYKGVKVDKVKVFGLDTEYIPKTNQPSELLSWQLAGDTDVLLTQKRLNIKNLYTEAEKMLHGYKAKVLIFVCFFSLAEIQFFNLTEWNISEFKGRYKLTQNYGGGRLMIVDLADWYQHESLKSVATQWGLKKVEYDIGAKVEAIVAGKLAKEELFDDPEFKEYAKMDAVLCQRIYVRMREFFLTKFDVDIVATMTPANTSASIFRLGISESIVQENTDLRKLALGCCWGGRMECLFRGQKPQVYEYDATAHHPSSAIFLNKLPLQKDWQHTLNLKLWLTGISGVGKVYFKFSPDEHFPCLPVMMDDALVFPLEGVSFCSVSEARLAKKKGANLILMNGYFYTSGTTALTEHLCRLQDIRNRSKDNAERKLLKLLSNAVIGKFFQKKIGVDLAKVQKYALENDIPVEEAIKLKGIDFGEGQITVGSCFYPEWYAIILGYARASIAEVAERHGALVISSDSFVTTQRTTDSFTEAGITFNLKAQGELISYRTRFYRVGDKIAHHAIHSLEAAKRILVDFSPDLMFEYDHRRLLHLKESWRTKQAFGSQTFRHMTANLGFDYKRKLLPDGTTVPWQTADERQEFLERADAGPNPLLEVVE